MSEDKRKNARTQGRFSGGDKEYSSRHDKQNYKNFSADKNKGEKKSPGVGSRVQKDMNLQYKEKSNYSFKELEHPKKPQELRFNGPKMVLSQSENGESRLIYDPDFMKIAEADNYMEKLRDATKWHDKKIVIRGEEHPQPRLVAWYGPHPYTYAGATLEAAEMSVTIRTIKEKVEAALRRYGIDVELNSVLLNWYRDEHDSVAWHSDDELSLGVSPTIASVSLGETRRFEMRPKEHMKDFDPQQRSFVNLTHGSLIIMDGVMQEDWQHRVPKEYHARKDRINLTFRTIYPIDQLHSKMPRSSEMKSSKSPSGKVVQQEEPNFDPESFPPLVMEADHKKTKLLAKENGHKEYHQSANQRKSPKGYYGSSEKKSNFLPKGNHNKRNQQSFSQRKYEKEENWDDEMLQGPGDTTQNNLNKKSDHDPVMDSPGLHQSRTDFNSNVGGSDKLYDSKFSSRDYEEREYYEDSSETWDDNELTGSQLLEQSPSEKKFVYAKEEEADFNSNIEKSSKVNNRFSSSGFVEKEFRLDNTEMRHSHKHESTDSRLDELKDLSQRESKPVELNAECIGNGSKASDLGKKYFLNADAPDFVPLNTDAPDFVPLNTDASDFVPQNKFVSYSLSDFEKRCYDVRDEDLLNFTDALFNCLEEKTSHFLDRDRYELETYDKLTSDGTLSITHWKIILERIGSMIRNANHKKNEVHRYKTRPGYTNRSFNESNYHRHKQSYARSPRY